ncbi:MAG: KpsF/GutQ family sugar-phosphate isomerase [Succinivibrio sp.]|nr:KpsF/GutQ family sugar-phosphate isomerase [Succinivibrio sp.]
MSQQDKAQQEVAEQRLHRALDYAVRCLKDEAQAILDLIPQLDDNFERALRLMYECKGKVIVTGVGKSGHIASKIAATLASTGTSSFYINPLDAYHGDLGMITSDDVVIAISYSGQTDELLRIMPNVLQNGAKVIGMSSNPNSLLARHATCHLSIKVDHEADPLNLAPTSSTTASLALGDALACALIEVRQFKRNDFARYHPGGSLGRQLLTAAKDVMLTDNLPVISPQTLLGEAVITISDGKLGLAVVEQDGAILGIVTDGDIRRAMQKHQEVFFKTEAKQIMSVNPKCVAPETSITAVQDLMQQNKIHSVLVVDEKQHLLGIVDSFLCLL